MLPYFEEWRDGPSGSRERNMLLIGLLALLLMLTTLATAGNHKPPTPPRLTPDYCITPKERGGPPQDRLWVPCGGWIKEGSA